MGVECGTCGRLFAWSGRGRRPSSCGQRCRKRRQRTLALPTALTALTRWTRADGKRPVTVSGRGASSTDPSTWATYAAVRSSRAGDGLGVMLGDGLACYDLDDVIGDDGQVSVEAAVVLAEVSALWIERSRSGRGLHVFVNGGGPSRQGQHVSYYSHSRFIRVTGDMFTIDG